MTYCFCGCAPSKGLKSSKTGRKSATNNRDRYFNKYARKLNDHSITSISVDLVMSWQTVVTVLAKCFSNNGPRSRANCAKRLSSSSATNALSNYHPYLSNGSIDKLSLSSMYLMKEFIISSWWKRICGSDSVMAFTSCENSTKFVERFVSIH